MTHRERFIQWYNSPTGQFILSESKNADVVKTFWLVYLSGLTHGYQIHLDDAYNKIRPVYTWTIPIR